MLYGVCLALTLYKPGPFVSKGPDPIFTKDFRINVDSKFKEKSSVNFVNKEESLEHKSIHIPKEFYRETLYPELEQKPRPSRNHDRAENRSRAKSRTRAETRQMKNKIFK